MSRMPTATRDRETRRRGTPRSARLHEAAQQAEAREATTAPNAKALMELILRFLSGPMHAFRLREPASRSSCLSCPMYGEVEYRREPNGKPLWTDCTLPAYERGRRPSPVSDLRRIRTGICAICHADEYMIDLVLNQSIVERRPIRESSCGPQRAGEAHLLLQASQRRSWSGFTRPRMAAACIGPQIPGMVLGTRASLQQHIPIGSLHQNRDRTMQGTRAMRRQLFLRADFLIHCVHEDHVIANAGGPHEDNPDTAARASMGSGSASPGPRSASK